MQVINLNAAKELVNTYKSISKDCIEEVKHNFESFDSYEIMNCITGFGSVNSCSLCKDMPYYDGQIDCSKCIHNVEGKWFKTSSRYTIPPCVNDTYSKMEDACNVEDLYNAIQNRVGYLEKLIKIVEENDN